MSDTKTRRMIVRMLKENTGRAMCDSGDAYGRHWEQNQKTRFASQPSATLDASSGYLDITLSVYHWLADRVLYSPELTRQFNAFALRSEYKDSGWLEIMEDFPEEFEYEKQGTVNTYNGEDWLSQTLQYVQFYIPDSSPTGNRGTTYILLQIHNGCDVRGGYTKPRVFQVEEDGANICDNAHAEIYCTRKHDPRQLPLPSLEKQAERKPHGWSIEPGYSQGYSDEEKSLLEYPMRELAENEKPETGAVCYRESGEAFCPVCASKLAVACSPSSW